MPWCNPPPLLRRLSSKKSYSEFALAKRAHLFRGDSKHSEKTYVDLKQPDQFKFVSEDDDHILLIDAPTPPPKESPLMSPMRELPPSPAVPSKDRLPLGPRPLPTPPQSTRAEKLLPIPKLELDLNLDPAFPWYRRRLVADDSQSRYTPSRPSVFPRSDFALSTTGSADVGLTLFGGLVNERAKNDVYSISVKEHSVRRLHTIGDIPSPRFGHASAAAGSVVVVWGGDTTSASSYQLRTKMKYDNGLYFLNLASREWTRVTADGPAPPGRIGHSVVMIGPIIYVFGGQADVEYFNDLWCFNLNTLVSTPAWEQIEPSRGGMKPPKRSGHTCVVYQKQLLMFGGNDGHYHYNDTWMFDTTTKTWTELSCTGYIPCPREGHAAAIIGDTMYVYGGRGVDGANIGRLAAFNMSSARWFMFQNMGPEPSARSGHGMVAVGTKVYVLGGVSEDDLDDSGNLSNVMFILETNNIKYPVRKRSTSHTRITLVA